MNIAIAGFRHYHIFTLYNAIKVTPGVTLCGCFEENNTVREAVAKDYGVEFSYASYEDILSDASVDAVGIGDYFGKRGQMVIAALRAGKHVICDKPICTDLAELDVIEALAKEKKLQVSCMLDLRYLSTVEKACEIVSGGEIGRIVNVSFTGQHCLDYANRPHWYYEDGKHGGTINDIAIHGVDLVRFITGKNLTKVNCARVWNAFATEEPQFKDCGQFMVEMDDISLMADVSYAAPKFSGTLPTYWDFYFWGTDGMINFNLASDTIRLYKNEKTEIVCEPKELSYLEDFYREIQGEKTVMNTFDILLSQRQVLEIQRAAEYGE